MWMLHTLIHPSSVLALRSKHTSTPHVRKEAEFKQRNMCVFIGRLRLSVGNLTW